MAGADLQKSPVLFIATFTQVPTRPLGAVIGVTFQVASFGKPLGTDIGMTFQLASFGKHIAKVFTGTRYLITGHKARRKRNRKPEAAAGGKIDILARVTAFAGNRIL